MAEGVWIPAPDRLEVSRCTCGAEIVWTVGSRGGKLALDRRHSTRINGALCFEPHWAYCPDGERHRRAALARRRARRRRCFALACPEALTPRQAKAGEPFCPRHWRELPREFREWLRREWRPSFLETGPSPAYVQAARNARALLHARRSRPLQGGLFGDVDEPGRAYD